MLLLLRAIPTARSRRRFHASSPYCLLVLLQAIASLLPEAEEPDMQDQHPWGDAAAAGANASTPHPTDPNKQLSHMLLIAAAAASLPCIAATKCMQLPQQIQQQQQQRQGGWCGVSFSGLPGLHMQLHQQLLQLLRHAGDQIRVSWPAVLYNKTHGACTCTAPAALAACIL
jgi:hypothetical protein